MRQSTVVYIRSLNLQSISRKAIEKDAVAATVVYEADTEEYIVSCDPEQRVWRFRTYRDAIEKADEIFLFWEKATDAIINFKGFEKEKK